MSSFRMLNPAEVAEAMGFPPEVVVREPLPEVLTVVTRAEFDQVMTELRYFSPPCEDVSHAGRGR